MTRKFSLVRIDSHSGCRRIRVLNSEVLMKRLKADNSFSDVTKLRACVSECRKKGSENPGYEHLDRLPMVMPAVHLDRKSGADRLEMKHYNGIVLLTVSACRPKRLLQLKEKAAGLPHTLAAFVGAEGNTLNILVPFTRPDGTLPQTEEKCRAFHSDACRWARFFYRQVLQCSIRRTGDSLYSAFRQTFDEQLYHNPSAVPMVIGQPVDSQMLPEASLADNVVENLAAGSEAQDCKSSKMLKNVMMLSDFLQKNFEIRYNQLLHITEFCRRDNKERLFLPFDQTARNSIALDAMEEGIEIIDRDVDRYLQSDRIPQFDPVADYLSRLEEWDGVDHIRSLAMRVPTDQPLWQDFFYRWFLGMVAHWMGADKTHGNCVAPVLIGPQGTRKSSFCRQILPPELRFGYSESIDVSNKREAELALSRFLLINLDEFDQITLHHQTFLKNLLQKPSANLRRPYAKSVEEMRRYASFIATSNHDDLLSDTTGARRYICVRVTGEVDALSPVDYGQLYAQALAAIRRGERWWFDVAEEGCLMRQNREFERISPMEQTFLQTFRVPEMQNEGEWYTSEQLLEVLHRDCHLPLSDSNRIFFGRIMKKLSVPSVRTNRGMRYRVVARERNSKD